MSRCLHIEVCEPISGFTLKEMDVEFQNNYIQMKTSKGWLHVFIHESSLHTAIIDNQTLPTNYQTLDSYHKMQINPFTSIIYAFDDMDVCLRVN